MKNNLLSAIKIILADRMITVLLGVFVLACVVYCIYVATSLHPSDLQVAVHYTAFGNTNYYREKWYYLVSFIIFGAVFAIAHVTVAVKIYVQERRQMALLFIGISYLVLFIAWVITRSVLRIAAF